MTMTPRTVEELQACLGESDKPEAFDGVKPNKLSGILPKALPDLEQFIGTETYWKYATPFASLLPARFGRCLQYTDGVKHVAESAAAYWLLDVIFSHVIEIYRNIAIDDDNKRLLVCKLARNPKGGGALFLVEDGNSNELARQDIEYTDFPALGQVVWVQNGVAMLPSEY